MKGMDLPVNKTFGMAIFIIVLLLVVVFIFMIPKALGGIDPLKQSQINDAKVKQLEDLGAFYDSFKKTDGGFDSYEASVLLAKVIEYTWEDCANFCESKMDIADFTNFFLTHPITLSKTLDCDTLYVYDKDTEHKISKGRISGYCKEADIGDDKTETADEWTTTIWGLYRNSVMCTNYFADGYQWGNFNCGSAETPNIKCNPLCGKGVDWTREITQDRIKSWEGAMTKGNSYSNIRVLYNPDCTLIAGFFPLSDQACLEVQISGGASATTCSDCVNSGKGWCSIDNQCKAGDDYGSTDKTCGGDDWIWGDESLCTLPSCKSYNTCQDCLDRFNHCGWCKSSGGSCKGGYIDSGFDGTSSYDGLCSGSDWIKPESPDTAC